MILSLYSNRIQVICIGVFGIFITFLVSIFLFIAKIKTGSGIWESTGVFGFLIIAVPLFYLIYRTGRRSFKSISFSINEIRATDHLGRQLFFNREEIHSVKRKVFCSLYILVKFKYDNNKYCYLLNFNQKDHELVK